MLAGSSSRGLSSRVAASASSCSSACWLAAAVTFQAKERTLQGGTGPQAWSCQYKATLSTPSAVSHATARGADNPPRSPAGREGGAGTINGDGSAAIALATASTNRAWARDQGEGLHRRLGPLQQRSGSKCGQFVAASSYSGWRHAAGTLHPARTGAASQSRSRQQPTCRRTAPALATLLPMRLAMAGVVLRATASPVAIVAAKSR